LFCVIERLACVDGTIGVDGETEGAS
jgi:hypothetical protein